MNNVKHRLTGFSEDEQIEYLCVMASLMTADARITDEELTRYVAGVFAEQSGNPARADWRAESANALTEAGVPLSVMAIAGAAAAKPSRSARILGLRW